MARQVEVHIKGLAFCFIRDMKWNIMLISDSVHPMKLTAPGMPPVDLRRGNKDLICEFFAPLVPNGTDPTFPTAMALNMSDPVYGHGVNEQGVSNLRFKRANNYGTLTMQLPESSLTLANPRPDVCWMQEVAPGGGGPKNPVTNLAEDWIFTFSINSDAAQALRLSISDRTNGDVYNQNFPATAAAGPLTFAFDNSCGTDCTRNDSIDLYDVISDKRQDRDRKFVSGALINGEVPGHNPTHSFDFSPTYGNCDPVGSEPPPWP